MTRTLLASSLAALAACSEGAAPPPTATADPVVLPELPIGVALPVPPVTPDDDEPPRPPTTASRIIYLNRDGGTFYPGADDSSDDTSSLIGGTAWLPPYDDTDAAWDTLVACMRDTFAPFDVLVTDVDPGDDTHVEAVIGGSPGAIGLPDWVGGYAPMAYDCTNIERAIVFIFAEQYGDPDTECAIAAQEVGHAYGLDHEMVCSDPMSYLWCGEKRFQDEWAWCGEYEARECYCGGQQNSVAHLLENIGPRAGDVDDVAPEVTLLSPADGAILPASSIIEVVATATDDVGVTQLVLDWNQGTTWTSLDCDADHVDVTCARDGDTVTWRLDVGTGERRFHVHAYDAAGNDGETETRTVSLAE